MNIMLENVNMKYIAVFFAAIILTACSDDSDPNRSKVSTLHIQSDRANCDGIEAGCVIARRSGSDSWNSVEKEIKGFDYSSDYYWIIEVENTSNDFKLLKVLSKSENDFTDNVKEEEIELDSSWGKCQSWVGFDFDCLKLRKLGSTEWETWSGEIEGFNYKPGLKYVLKVKKSIRTENPIDDDTFYRRELIKIISSSTG